VSEARLILGDCLDVLRTLDGESVDAVVTDPPYCAGAVSEASRTRSGGQGLRSENLRRFGWFVGDNMGTAGLAFLLRSVAVESRRLLKASGSLLVFCDWRMQATLQPAIESAGLRYQGLIVWDKGSMGLGRGFRCQHELILHFTNGSPEYHNRSTSNVIRCPRVKADREHQTQKPVDLMQQLLKVVSPDGGTVLDPFAGSGTTGVAAAQMGLSFIGVEQSPEYHAIAERRIADARAALEVA
jgi:DNA modification methylase